MKISKKISLIALAGLTLALSGCSYNTMADAAATPYSVVELTNATLTENSTFGYTDSEGQVRGPWTTAGSQTSSLKSTAKAKADL